VLSSIPPATGLISTAIATPECTSSTLPAPPGTMDAGARGDERVRHKSRSFGNLERREKILSDFTQSTLDPVGPVGNQDQKMRVLVEMNELEQTIWESVPRIDVL